jgi:hypothetical protein
MSFEVIRILHPILQEHVFVNYILLVHTSE